MALENNTVLDNLKEQLKTVSEQYENLSVTRLKILGAIDVLEQIESSKEETTEEVDVVENEGDE